MKAIPHRISGHYDAAVVGGGVMGCTTALFLARAGMRVVLLERDALCRAASGVNAGTLTLHMTRAALVPYALRAWDMWMHADTWLGGGVLATAAAGLSLAFTDAECALLRKRADARRQYGAAIDLISAADACGIEPGHNNAVRDSAILEKERLETAKIKGRA